MAETLNPGAQGMSDAVIRAMLQHLIDEHPLPWQIEQDWSPEPEIYDDDGEKVLASVSLDAAKFIVDLAVNLDREPGVVDDVPNDDMTADEGRHLPFTYLGLID